MKLILALGISILTMVSSVYAGIGSRTIVMIEPTSATATYVSYKGDKLCGGDPAKPPHEDWGNIQNEDGIHYFYFQTDASVFRIYFDMLTAAVLSGNPLKMNFSCNGSNQTTIGAMALTGS